MSVDDIQQRGLAHAEYLAGLTQEERGRINEHERTKGEAEHKAFQEKFKGGRCWVCGDALTAFDPAKPCPHWLLKPDGFGKEHFNLLAEKYSVTKLEHYARWVANEEAFAKNINDLADEGSGKLVELTAKYKNLQWSFSCGASDLSGHEGAAEHSQRPHWHFQMYVNDQPFIRYNDFHAPLSEEDVGLLEHMRKNPGKVRKRFAGGAGMGDVLHESTLDQVVALGRSAETDDEADFGAVALSTIMIAEPGKSFSGDEIYRLIQEARAEKVTVTSKLRQLKEGRITTFVSPGPGVVAQAVRSGGRKRKKGNRSVIQDDRAWREILKRQTDTRRNS
jgi:hypothetical protein